MLLYDCRSTATHIFPSEQQRHKVRPTHDESSIFLYLNFIEAEALGI